MRALKIACGIAVLLNALHLTHAIHHFVVHAPRNPGPGVWAAVAAALVVGVLSLIGGVWLIRDAR